MKTMKTLKILVIYLTLNAITPALYSQSNNEATNVKKTTNPNKQVEIGTNKDSLTYFCCKQRFCQHQKNETGKVDNQPCCKRTCCAKAKVDEQNSSDAKKSEAAGCKKPCNQQKCCATKPNQCCKSNTSKCQKK